MYFKLLPVGEVMPSLSLPQAGTREAQDAVRGFGFRVWDFGFGGSDLVCWFRGLEFGVS